MKYILIAIILALIILFVPLQFLISALLLVTLFNLLQK